MKLSRYTLKNISAKKVVVPAGDVFELPERILQFGTGALLRGLPDYFIDKANQQGIFNGRVIMVKSTSKGNTADFEKQNSLYTLCMRGVQEGGKVEKNCIISSVSRILIAKNEWDKILECAHNEQLKIIISNTTEVGIQLVNENIQMNPPTSFPGKLLAFMYERFIAFSGNANSGFVIIPTELIPGNGEKLKSIVLELAHLNSIEDDFIKWIEHCNYFCNSLVDRIVTGMPDAEIKSTIENELGYTDELLTISEVYGLWAIEGDGKIKNILSFAEADEGVVIEPNIDLYRELKLRLLNGTHTLTCGLAFLSNFDTVRQSMEDETMSGFIADLMKNELSPSIPYEIEANTKQLFISKVLDRFRNSYINHHWKSITLNYSSKMKMRCIPLLINHYKNNGTAPPLFALGFASYLYFMKVVKQRGEEFFGELNKEFYLIEDELAEKFYALWQSKPVDNLVKDVLKDKSLWDTDLSQLPGFQQSITENLNGIINNGMTETLEKVYQKKISA